MKSFGRIFVICLIIFLSCLLSTQTAQACTCVVNDTVDIDFAKTPNIAVFRLQSLEKYAESEKGYGYGGIKQSRLRVEKVFKGNLKVGQELIFAQGGGADCIWTFGEKSIGESYLFYLGNKPISPKATEKMISSTTFGNPSFSQGVWVATTCSGSGNVKYRMGDVKYLENVTKFLGKTRLSGTIMQNISSSVKEIQSTYKFLADQSVHVVGNGKNIELKTDENGFYEVYDLPVGKYKLSVEPIAGYKTTMFDEPTVESKDIEIKPRQHTEIDFDYFIDNSISGKILDSKGEGMKDVCLELLPIHGERAKYYSNFDCSEEDGTFKLSQIPEGKYLIVVNYHNKISASEPFGLFYYPNALKREQGTPIEIRAGQHSKDFVITPSASAEIITITGKLLFENGIPKEENGYEYISVEFVPDQKTEGIDGDSRAFIDDKGNFTLRVLKGQKGKFYGEMLTYIGDRVNCPKLDSLLRKKGNRAMDITSNSIIIDGSKNLTDVILKFPFPYCKKREIE